MKNLPTAEEARQWLTVQLEILNELRTAGPRNPAFQQWRNNTLALAERIWPHHSTKYKRFRRIPFQPSSAKSDERAARECFEKGCAEARRLIQLWIAEINLHGLLHSDEGGAPDPMPDLGDAPASEAPGQRGSRPTKRGGGLGRGRASDTAPGTGHVPRGRAFGVGRGSGASGRGSAKSQAKRSKPRLKDMLGLGDGAPEDADDTPRPERPRVEPPPRPAIPLLRGPASPKHPVSSSSDFTIERLERPNPADQGPDVLEKSIFEAMQAALSQGSETESGTWPAGPRDGADRDRDPDSEADGSKDELTLESPQPEASVEPPAGADDAPVAEIAMDVPHAGSAEPEAAPEPDEDIRSDTPFPDAEAAPAAEAPVAVSGDATSDDDMEPRARAVSEIVRLASDLDLLGVPEEEQRAVRAALLEVGRTLDSDAPAWDAIEEAVARAVRHPALARRFLPLLTPYLDEAA